MELLFVLYLEQKGCYPRQHVFHILFRYSIALSHACFKQFLLKYVFCYDTKTCGLPCIVAAYI